MKQRKGFTLVELLVVIAIIGLISTLAFVSLNSTRARARDAVRLSDVDSIQTALELYYSENDKYPSGTGCISQYQFRKLAKVCISSNGSDDWISDMEDIMPKIPNDPLSENPFNYNYMYISFYPDEGQPECGTPPKKLWIQCFRDIIPLDGEPTINISSPYLICFHLESNLEAGDVYEVAAEDNFYCKGAFE